MAMGAEADVTRTEFGWRYIHWGFSLFVVGFFTGFIPILHYMVGGLSGAMGPNFLATLTLWWGCPAILAELTLKTGSLGMIGIGFSHLAIARQGEQPDISRHEQLALTLCAYGLIATLVAAGLGYVICSMIWPGFYYRALNPGKNLWLAAQGLCILVFVIGLLYAIAGIRKASEVRP
jgi:hypothetical protein